MKYFPCLLMAAVVALSVTGCGAENSAEAEAEEIQREFAASDNLRLSAELTANYGERAYSFQVSYEGMADDGTVTITAPENIAGVSVRYADGGTTLVSDGAEVYTGELLPDGVSPVDAVPVITETWRSGLITGAVREKCDGADCVMSDFMVSEDVTLRTWFDRVTDLPVRAEMSIDGFTALSAVFYNVVLE